MNQLDLCNTIRNKPIRSGHHPRKLAVYTVIVDNYDEVKQPAIIDNRFDYILFSNTHTNSVGVWKVRPIPLFTDKKWLLARYPKLNPEIVMPEYDAWLYIDGTIKITSQYVYDRCVELADANVDWAGMKHQARNCIYDEINAILAMSWVHDYEVLDWYKVMREDGFPAQAGLFENNIFFRTNSENVRKIDDMWRESISNFRFRRDQFSLMYAIWKHPTTKTTYLLPPGETAWNNNGHFSYYEHNPHQRNVKQTIWEKWRNRCCRACFNVDDGDIYHIYTDMFDILIPFKYPHVAMHVWTLYVSFRYGGKALLGVIQRKTRKALRYSAIEEKSSI